MSFSEEECHIISVSTYTDGGIYATAAIGAHARTVYCLTLAVNAEFQGNNIVMSQVSEGLEDSAETVRGKRRPIYRLTALDICQTTDIGRPEGGISRSNRKPPTILTTMQRCRADGKGTGGGGDDMLSGKE